MKKIIFSIMMASLPFFYGNCAEKSNPVSGFSPIKTVSLIGEKLIRDTPFKFRLEVSKPVPDLSTLQCVDFGRAFSLGKQAVALAYTQINSELEQKFDVEIEHNDGCRIWLNNELIYSQNGEKAIRLNFDERVSFYHKKLL